LEANFLSSESNTVELNQAQLASMLITLEKTFCKSLHIILHHLLSSFSSSSITLRSRALKSLLLLLKEDPSLLERPYIIKHIRRLLDDSSARVRESALRAFAEVLSTSSELDKEMYDLIIIRARDDPSTGVQTAAMKILKDIYKRHDGDLAIQSAIANAFLQKVSHPEKKSIAEPAIQSLEELWFLPLYVASVNEERNPKSKQQLSTLAKLMVQTVKRNPRDTTEFDILLRSLLSKQTSKNAAGNSIVSAHIVSVLYDEMISNANVQDSDFRRFALETLAVFARADPSMFTTDRLEIMQPYLENLSTEDDLAIYQSVLVIYRHVFPKTKLLQTPFLEKVKGILMKRVSKLSKRPSLMETALCLQIIAEKLNNSSFLVTLSISALKLLRQLTKDTSHIEENRVKLKRVNFVLGAVGHASKLDDKAKAFQNEFPNWKGKEVAGLFVDFLAPLTGPPYPDEIEEAALGSICQICQAWPKQFMRKDVQQAIDRVFTNDNENMEGIVLSAFRDFYLLEEKKSDTGALIAVGEGAKTGAKRLNVSLNPDENDGASPGIAQKFLPYFTKLALASTDGLAVTATEVLASISRQGLLHPKECGVAFIALETSPNLTISTLAFQEHKKIHEKHETLIEMEYTKAIPRVFKYQKDVVKDHRGATSQPLLPKLQKLFEILKDGSVKVRKKFFANMVKELSFDFDKLSSNRDAWPDLLFTQFVVENLALYESPRLEELWKLVTDMEKVVIAAGSRVLETINTEVLKVSGNDDPDMANQLQAYDGGANYFISASGDIISHIQDAEVSIPPGRTMQNTLTDSRLRQITIAAVRLTIIWETRSFLRRLWNLAKYGKTGPAKDVATRAPTKAQGVSGDKYMDLISQIMSCFSGGTDAMVAQCKASAELLSTDYEFKTHGSDDDGGELGNGYETPQEDGDGFSTPSGKRGITTPGSGKGKKRKLSSSGRNEFSSFSGTPLKKKGQTPGSGGKPKKMKSNGERSGSANSLDDADGEWE
jgi:cohesin loading factor subunit SCC2